MEIEQYEEKVAQLISGAGFRDPIIKTMRAYETELHPAVVERLRVHLDSSMEVPFMYTATFRYPASSSNAVWGSDTIEYWFSSFYAQEELEGTSCKILTIKPSTKTYAGDEFVQTAGSSDFDFFSIKAAIIRELDCNPPPEKFYRMNQIVRILQPELSGIFQTTVNDIPNSQYARNLFMFVNQNDFVIDSTSTFGGIPSCVTPNQLVMSDKWYEKRQDHRAFFRDTDALRNLVGSMLNRLLNPRNSFEKNKSKAKWTMPTESKDMLDLQIRIPAGWDAVLLIGDISNFTGSLANSWAMTFAMAMDASQGLLAKQSMFQIGRHLIYARWDEILLLYSMMTIGLKCTLPHGQISSLPGGYLGVTGNIAIGLLFLTYAMDYLHTELRRALPHIIFRAQVGGDDHAIMVSCPKEEMAQVLKFIQDYTFKYLGQVKEYHLTHFEFREKALPTTTQYCKKGVFQTVEYFSSSLTATWRVRSIPSIPICLELVLGMHIEDPAKTWGDFDRALRNYTNRFGYEHIEFINSLRSSYLSKFNRLAPRFKKHRHSLDPYTSSRHGDFVISDRAFDEIFRVHRFQTETGTYLESLISKIAFLARAEILEFIQSNSVDELTLIVFKDHSEDPVISESTWYSCFTDAPSI